MHQNTKVSQSIEIVKHSLGVFQLYFYFISINFITISCNGKPSRKIHTSNQAKSD